MSCDLEALLESFHAINEAFVVDTRETAAALDVFSANNA